MDTRAGGSASSGTFTTTNVGTSPPVGDRLVLVKTGNGEFVLSGVNAQKLLMEYFEQAPELWLRLMAIKAGEEVE